MTVPTDARQPLGRSLVPILALTVIWGSNWPILKLAVAEMPPLSFRLYVLAFAGLGLLAIAKASGESIRIPRKLWLTVGILATFNIAGWNGLVLFGVQQMPAGRSAILAYTMPVWAAIISLLALQEPLSRRKLLGLLLGMAGMAVLLWDDLSAIEKSPSGALMVLGAAVVWAIGTVLLRKWKPPIAPTALSGWMMIVGWTPFLVGAPLLDPLWLQRIPSLSATAWFAIVYNIVLAGTVAHWAWFTLARTLPVAVSSLSVLPVPVVGVLAGIIVLGERPGHAEWIALALVLAALVAVLLPPLGRKPEGTAPVVTEPEP